MRRKTFRRLAHATRAAFLLGALGAATTAAVWQFWPGLLPRVELGLRKTLQGPFYVAWERGKALQASDPAAARQVFAALADELRFVAKGDQLQPMLADVLGRLGHLAEAAGDFDAAVAAARRQVALDDHDVPARMRLGELLCSRPATRDEGLRLLEELWRRIPSKDELTALLVRKLVAVGQPERAAAVLRDSRGTLRSALWLVRWAPPGSDDDRRRHAGLVPREIEGGRIELRFAIAGPLQELSLLPPGNTPLRLEETEIGALLDGKELRIGLDSPLVRLQDIRRTGEAWQTITPAAPRIRVALPVPLPEGDHEFVFRARLAPAISGELAALAFAPELHAAESRGLPPELAAAVAELRVQGLAGSRLQVFWRGAGEKFAGERSVRATLDGVTGQQQVSFDTALELDIGKAASLRIDFPEYPGARYAFSAIELTTPAGPLVLDGRGLEIEHLHSLQRDGGEFVVSGPDPYFAFPVPDGPRAVRGLRLQGVAR